MKLLLDENLGRRRVPGLQEAFAGTPHVEDLGLQGKPDTLIWAAARRQAYALVQAATTAIPPSRPPMRACHAFGPVSCTLVPAESTATVTGMSLTSNS